MAHKRKRIFDGLYAQLEETDGNVVLFSARGEPSVIFEITNPVQQLCTDAQQYMLFHDVLSNILQTIGEGYALQKQDILCRQAYHHDVPDDAEFLTRSYFRYFEGREFTEIRTFLILTQEAQRSQFIQYDPKRWLDFHSKVSKTDDILTEKHIRHRKLGKELGLFTIMDEGPGFPFFLPNGMVLRNTLIDYWREVHKRYGYVEISTPMMLNRSLWERSGHWDHYKENMYTTVIDDTDFAIKPMNCPGGMLVYKLQPHSYRDLPLRMGELGLVHRHELSGALHGLFRVRCFTQDDAHIFMTWDQMKDEIKGVVRLFDEVYSVFGLTYQIEVSTMPEDHMGDEKDWDFATETLKAAVTEMGKDFVINEGDGAFYGPKLDFHLSDSLGRTWQCGTIQLDMQLPERFELEYTGADGEKHRPVMIHRVVLGSIERFIGVITEHFAGAFPLWLAPEQVRILPISDKFHDYAQDVCKQLDMEGLRVSVDTRSEKIGYKIREAQLHKIPYMLIIGEKEVESGTVSVRKRGEGDIGAVRIGEFVDSAKLDIAEKNIW